MRGRIKITLEQLRIAAKVREGPCADGVEIHFYLWLNCFSVVSLRNRGQPMHGTTLDI